MQSGMPPALDSIVAPSQVINDRLQLSLMLRHRHLTFTSLQILYFIIFFLCMVFFILYACSCSAPMPCLKRLNLSKERAANATTTK